jgi:hypothetical protein
MHVEGPPTPKPSIEMKGEKRRGREERGRGKRQQPLELGGEGRDHGAMPLESPRRNVRVLLLA